jgi:hypothetical protein
VKGDLVGLDFSIFDVGLVSYETDGGVGADFVEVHVPLLNISVGISVGEIKHDDGAMSVNIITLSQLSEFLLSCSVPDVEPDFSVSGAEVNVLNDRALGGVVGFLEMAREVSLDEGGLADTAVSDEDHFEGWDLLLGCHY